MDLLATDLGRQLVHNGVTDKDRSTYDGRRIPLSADSVAVKGLYLTHTASIRVPYAWTRQLEHRHGAGRESTLICELVMPSIRLRAGSSSVPSA